MYSHYPTNWWEMYREGENIIWFVKIWLKLFIPSVINSLDDMSDLHHDLERFWLTTWFGTILTFNMIWNDFDLQHDLERFWLTTWLIVHILGVPQSSVPRTFQIVHINARDIPERIICYLPNGILLLAFYYIFLL